MKKVVLIGMAITLVCAIAFTGCSQNSAQGASASAAATAAATMAATTTAAEERAQTDPSTAAGTVYTDMMGRDVTVAATDTIVSIAPSATEILYELGLGDSIVGVDAYSYYPEDAATKEIVGDYNGPDVEKIVALEPDVVFCGNTLQQEQIDSMEKMGITVISTEAVAFEDIQKSIELIGSIVGKETEAKAIVDTINTAAADAQAKAPAESKTVYFVMSFGDMGNWTSGPGSFINTIIELGGGTPVTKDAASSWIEYPIEDLINDDPDIILLSSQGGSLEDLKAATGYADLSAVKNGQVYVVDADVISRPGPRIAEAIGTISDIVSK